MVLVLTPGPAGLNVPSSLLMISRLILVGLFPILTALVTFTPGKPSEMLFQYLPAKSGPVVDTVPKSNRIRLLTVTITCEVVTALLSSVTLILKLLPALLIGAVIGFLSGLIGIGGGILLSPLLLLLGWANMKESAAVSSLFIFVNSITVMLSLNSSDIVSLFPLWPVPLVVLAGGFIGSRFGAFTDHIRLLKGVLAVVLLIASVKLVLV